MRTRYKTACQMCGTKYRKLYPVNNMFICYECRKNRKILHPIKLPIKFDDYVNKSVEMILCFTPEQYEFFKKRWKEFDSRSDYIRALVTADMNNLNKQEDKK